MTSNPDQIRQDIERTRASLSGDVDALNEKVNPARVVDRRMSAAKGRIARSSTSMTARQVHVHPRCVGEGTRCTPPHLVPPQPCHLGLVARLSAASRRSSLPQHAHTKSPSLSPLSRDEAHSWPMAGPRLSRPCRAPLTRGEGAPSQWPANAKIMKCFSG